MIGKRGENKVSMLGQLKLLALLFGIFIIGLSFFSDTLAGAKESKETNSLKPLFHATLGNILSFDKEIQSNVEALKDTSLSAPVVSALKNSIWTILVFFLGLTAIIFLCVKFLVHWGISKEQENYTVVLGALIFTLLIIVIANVFYKAYFYGVWEFPFQGVKSLVDNWQVMSNTGVPIGTVVSPVIENVSGVIV